MENSFPPELQTECHFRFSFVGSSGIIFLMRQLIHSILGGRDGELRFLGSTIGVGLLIVLAGVLWLLFFYRRDSQSFFEKREADDWKYRSRHRRTPGEKDELAEAKLPKRPAPLGLPGIRIDGAAHEILGLSPHASLAEIQKAYRELMKRFHPDKVGPAGTQRWRDAQKIAEALNRAKDEMTLKAKQQSKR